jgi:prephenate dehydratase
MRIGYLGPEGTFTQEALVASGFADGAELVPIVTIRETVLAVQDGEVDRALVPVENAIEGAVNATLDTLAAEAEGVSIFAEAVHPIRNCLIVRPGTQADQIETVVSHPQAVAQCGRFLRDELGGPAIIAATSTAEAVRTVASGPAGHAALGPKLSAELYGGAVLREGVDDSPDNATRFVLLGPSSAAGDAPSQDGAKTSIVFWGVGDNAPGWLARCLTEIAQRDVNLTLIESRPRRGMLGHYMFFADLDGSVADAPVAEAIEAVRGHVEALRVLGSYAGAA